MQKENIRRKSKNFRLTNFTVQELNRLSMKLKTSMTQIVEIAVSQFSQRQQHNDVADNNNGEAFEESR
jgi:predicted transcriptional regulator